MKEIDCLKRMNNLLDKLTEIIICYYCDFPIMRCYCIFSEFWNVNIELT